MTTYDEVMDGGLEVAGIAILGESRTGTGCCYIPPCQNPDALEYQKCAKPQNSSGCCQSCSGGIQTNPVDTDEPTIIRNRWTRADFLI